MWSAECCCVALFREPIKWLVFDVQTHVSVLCAVQFHISVFWKIDFTRFTAKRKRSRLKGIVKGSLRKKQFVQQQEMPKKAIMSGKRANHSFSCSSKTLEWNSFAASFPMCRKDSRTAMSWQLSWSSIQRTRRPNVSSFVARMKSNCIWL